MFKGKTHNVEISSRNKSVKRICFEDLILLMLKFRDLNNVFKEVKNNFLFTFVNLFEFEFITRIVENT